MDANHKFGSPTRVPLLRALRDGSARAGTRLMVSLAAALLLLAVSDVMAYVLGYLIPHSPPRGPAYMVFVRGEVLLSTYISAGLVYLALMFWIWSRQRRGRGIWLGAAITTGIWLVTIGICILVDNTFWGDDEFLIQGVVFAAAGLTLLVWIHLYRRHLGGRSLFDESGVIDLRCPACQYRMVGLKQSRCPECGQEYTLDELVGKQDFEVLRLRRSLMGPWNGPDTPAGLGKPVADEHAR